jgi:hypothetical protein
MANDNLVSSYRRSVTPGTPVSTRSQQRLKELRCDPLGRLVLQLTEIDLEIKSLKDMERPSRMVIATLMALKYNVLKDLMPYAYSKVPQEQTGGGNNVMPVVINIDGKAIMDEEQGLYKEINEALEEARETFPEYKPTETKTIGPGWKVI